MGQGVLGDLETDQGRADAGVGQDLGHGIHDGRVR